MLINFQCRQCRLVFDSEAGQITMPADAHRPPFEHPIGCPRCGQRSLDEVWLTELGQSQRTAAVLSSQALVFLMRLSSPIKQLFQRGQAWWRFYQQHQATLRPAIVDNVIAMLSCALSVRGYAFYTCSNSACTHTKKVPFSCKSRFCPSCGKKATDQWIATRQAVLPHTRWQHITFTMPGALWLLFKENYVLSGQLSALAAKPVQVAGRQKGVLPGIFTALHTFGRDLKYNVHVHLSVTRGGLSDDHSAWKS